MKYRVLIIMGLLVLTIGLNAESSIVDSDSDSNETTIDDKLLPTFGD